MLEERFQRNAAKQRITSCRPHWQLREEGAEVGLTLVLAELREWRRRRAEVYVSLVHCQAERFAVLASHYAFEAGSPRPGEGHDMAGVEGRDRGQRWQVLTPLPRDDSLEQNSDETQAAVDRLAPGGSGSASHMKGRYCARCRRSRSRRRRMQPVSVNRSAKVRL